MQKNTDALCSWKDHLQKLWSRFRVLLAVTFPVWIITLSIQGSLGHRLLGTGVTLLFLLSGLYSLRWILYGLGLLLAVDQRREEKQKGELNDAKKY